MLTHISISNYTIVSSLDIDLAPGMTVITGETGAGKLSLYSAKAAVDVSRKLGIIAILASLKPVACCPLELRKQFGIR